jgi:hypothetical protein
VLRCVSWRGGAAAGGPRPGAGVADTDSAADTGDTACDRTGSCTGDCTRHRTGSCTGDCTRHRTRHRTRTGREAGPGDGAIRGR